MNNHRVDLQTEDGTLDLYIFQPQAGSGPWPAVVMYMDAFGIRTQLGDMAQRLASHGYVVALPNLYHRTPFAPFDPKQVAVDGPERARFKGMVASINGPMVMRDTAAVLAHLDTLPAVTHSPLGADNPDSPPLQAPQMRARVYVGAAGLDPTFPEEQRQRLETALTQAGVSYIIETYENAKHGFAVNGHLVYDKEASERHWERLLRLLQDTLH